MVSAASSTQSTAAKTTRTLVTVCTVNSCVLSRRRGYAPGLPHWCPRHPGPVHDPSGGVSSRGCDTASTPEVSTCPPGRGPDYTPSAVVLIHERALWGGGSRGFGGRRVLPDQRPGGPFGMQESRLLAVGQADAAFCSS